MGARGSQTKGQNRGPWQLRLNVRSARPRVLVSGAEKGGSPGAKTLHIRLIEKVLFFAALSRGAS